MMLSLAAASVAAVALASDAVGVGCGDVVCEAWGAAVDLVSRLSGRHSSRFATCLLSQSSCQTTRGSRGNITRVSQQVGYPAVETSPDRARVQQRRRATCHQHLSPRGFFCLLVLRHHPNGHSKLLRSRPALHCWHVAASTLLFDAFLTSSSARMPRPRTCAFEYEYERTNFITETSQFFFLTQMTSGLTKQGKLQWKRS